MTECSSHDESNTVSVALATLAVGGVLTAGFVMLSPHILPAIGIGSEMIAAESITALHASSGIAGAINKGLEAIPVIGSGLADGGFFNTIAAGLVGITGVLGGNVLTKKGNRTLGRLVTYGALVTSALIALPTTLTAIGSGLIFLSTLGGNFVAASQMVSAVDNTIGTMAGINHPMMGLSGFAAAIPHFMTCGTALLPAALSYKLWKNDQKHCHDALPAYRSIARDTHGVPLPFNDPNHFLTPEEFGLVQSYNAATPTQKILLKKQLLEQGYQPDFHTDGTIHLYRHRGHNAQHHAYSR